MKSMKKLISLLLAVAMVLALAACTSTGTTTTTESSWSTFEEDAGETAGTTGKEGGKSGTTTTTTGGKKGSTTTKKSGKGTSASIKESSTNPEKKYKGKKNPYANLDLKGAKIRFAAPWGCEPGKAGTSTAATLSWERIHYLEKTYNCKFEFMNNGTNDEKMKTSVAAGNPYCDFQIMYTGSLPAYAINGYLQNMDKMTAINFKESKWTAGSLSNGAFNGGHYAFNNGVEAPRYCIVFNKTLFDRMKWESPYKLYKSGKWTWNKLLELAKKATDKTAGRFGFSGMPIAGSSVIASFGGAIFSVDFNTGKPTFTGDSEECRLAAQLIYDINNKYKDYIWSPASYTWASFVNGVAEGKCAMAVTQMYMIRENILDMEEDYGIVPIPKGDNAKGKYVSIQEDIPTWVMLGNNPLAQEKAYIFDLYTEPFPGYEDAILQNEIETYARDNDAVEIMMEVARKYGQMDYSIWFQSAANEYSGKIFGAVTGGTGTFAEALGAHKNKVITLMNDTYNSWSE